MLGGSLLQRFYAIIKPSNTVLNAQAHLKFKERLLAFNQSWIEHSSTLLLGPNKNAKCQNFLAKLGAGLDVIGFAMTQQCNRVAALRLKRAYQIILLYQRIYGKQLLKQKIRSGVHLGKRPLLALLSAAFFQWEKERVTDEQLEKCWDDIAAVQALMNADQTAQKISGTQIHSSGENQEWEPVVDKDHFKIWRRLLPDSDLYQYKVYGQFLDIPPRAFYNTQVDLAYWKDWDKNTMEVKIIEKDVQTTSELVHWVYRFPYPMYPRDYVYVRRFKADPVTNKMIITARATEHPSCPEIEACVRIKTYCSQMVIKPHSSFDENGFDYVMTYFDDPQTNFPPMCYNWLASTVALKGYENISQKPNDRQ
ncbi:star-related lipid transfer protein 7, mitochondrial [Plakobranchus ocellatus]|uniref:Phosphatidylcholine transfer protein n=1 Tax=Plakobranchus ocellatus TaxID=259542 RepID=A0AAV4DDF4_9GAST|nr:star-related lipid transfer protein 7, mitochondrial [Plakobranchus ocellatus]